MIEALFMVLDRMIEYLGKESRKRRATFEELHSPVFDELLEIHRDYVMMFEHALRMLEHPDACQGVYKAIDFLKSKRIAFEPVRAKIIALTSLDFGTLEAGDSHYLKAVKQYLPRGEVESRSTQASQAIELLESSSLGDLAKMDASQQAKHRDEVALALRNTINKCRMRWSEVCEAYAALRKEMIA